MIPNTDQALRNIAHRLMVSLVPELRSEYAMADGMSLGMLINVIADELAEGIQRRLEDITEMQEVLGSCELSEKERGVAEAGIDNYSLKAVNARHDELTSILIDWHEKSEADDSLGALNHAIWQYLRRHANRHVITAIPEA
ncbi:MAG: hypothetical protein HOC70_10000 [Gammaproteobacteria bacterium]|jgi:hypothetical protein|nr:hypothetical protein [Gammaproteobacteria bacterium]MBT4493565.1 hypothetical protein [Gammaproteobacteria bacterium]